MTDNTTDFFDGIGEGAGAPTAVLKNPGDMVAGEIVKMTKRDYIPFGQEKPELRGDGTPKQQLVVVLQTENRNWANVVKVPKVDGTDPNSPEKAPSEDDGQRAVYVPEGKNLQFAIGRAVQAAAQAANKPVKFEVGGTLAVRVSELVPTTKGNPRKEHEARYTAKPEASGDAFFGGSIAPSAPAQPTAPAAQPALAQGSSFGGGDRGLNAPAQPAAPATPPPAAPVTQDPWATPAGVGNDEPPF